MKIMLSHSFGVIAISAIVANALVLPPGIASEGNSDPVDTFVNPKSQSIQLPCSACAPLSSRTGPPADLDSFWNEDGQGNIDVVLNFAISHDGQRLELNGEGIYPPKFHREAHLQGRPIYVNRISAPAAEPDVPLEITSSGLKIESGRQVSDDGDTVIPLRFFIMALEGQRIDGFPEVAINLLNTSNGEFFILKVDSVANSNSRPLAFVPDQSDEVADTEKKDCGVLPVQICRLRHIIAQRLAAVKLAKLGRGRPCMHAKGYSSKHVKSQSNRQGNNARPHFRQGRQHQKGSRFTQMDHKYTFFRSFSRLAIAVLIPIMAGILVGLSVCFLGLLFGRLIGYLWYKSARCGNHGYARISLDDTGENLSKILIDGQEIDPVPAYEDAPPYEEVEGEQR